MSAHCAARSAGTPELYPAPRRRAAPREIEALGAIVESVRSGALLMARRPSQGLLGGLWEVPCTEGADSEQLRSALETRSGLRLGPGAPLASVRHLFSHRSLTLRIERFALLEGTPTELRTSPGDELRWCSPAQLDELPLSALMRKVLRARADHRQPG